MILWTKIWTDDRAASMVEYALLIVLIALVAIVTLSLLGDNIAELFGRAASDLDSNPVTPTTAP
jgi:Flp pilus assembly pilin Flp